MSKINFTEKPPALDSMVRSALQEISASASAPEPLKSLECDALKIGAHHYVYDLDLSAIKAGKGVEAARLTGSRLLVRRDAETLAVTEHLVDDAGENPRFASVNAGPFVQGFIDAVKKAEALPSKRHFDCHVLRVASLYVMALWLKPVNGKSSVFIPMQPAPKWLSEDSYDEDGLMTALKAHAAEAKMPA